MKEWEEQIWPKFWRLPKPKVLVIIFGDEVSFAQWGSLGRTWAPKGKQPTLKTSGKRKGLKIFGVIEFVSGNFMYQECDGKFNGNSYIEFLEQVVAQYSCPVTLTEDGAARRCRQGLTIAPGILACQFDYPLEQQRQHTDADVGTDLLRCP